MRGGNWTDEFDMQDLPTSRTRAPGPMHNMHYPSEDRGNREGLDPTYVGDPNALAGRPNPSRPFASYGGWSAVEQPQGDIESASRPLGRQDGGVRTQPTWSTPDQAKMPVTKNKKKAAWYRRKVVVILAAILLLSSGLTALAAVNTVGQYRRDSQLANDGIARLRSGVTLLRGVTGGAATAQQMSAAKQDFTTAKSDFDQISRDLAQMPGVASDIPVLGGKLASAIHLLPVAQTGAQAGILGSDALQIFLTGLSDPLSTTSKGLKQTDLDAISKDLTQLALLLQTATQQIAGLQPADLTVDPRLGPAVTQFKQELPKIQSAMQDAQTIVHEAPLLLGVGKPTNYLVELLDSTELRPGGGFIGNIGTLTLSGGLLNSLHVQDVDLLDRPFEFAGGFIPYPQQYKWFQLASSWSVRDSNLDADFPTDALNAEKNYKLEGGTTPVQGVISITPWVIQKALAITGPIYVPEFKETVTASNLVDLIHLHQLGPGHGSEYIPDPASLSSMRKRFTAFLFEHFLARVKAIQSAKRGQFVHLLLSAISSKDVQMYFNDKPAEDVLNQLNGASTIATPQSDSLFVVDANVIGNKANDFITYQATDNVTLDANGTATHVTTLSYSWPITKESQANDYGVRNLYRDYVRVYAPPSAQLTAQAGWTSQGTSKAFGRAVFAGILEMSFGSKATISLTWKVPGAATKSGTTWKYSLLRQRQAGVTWSVTEQVTLPACAAHTINTSNLKA